MNCDPKVLQLRTSPITIKGDMYIKLVIGLFEDFACPLSIEGPAKKKKVPRNISNKGGIVGKCVAGTKEKIMLLTPFLTLSTEVIVDMNITMLNGEL